MRRVDVAVVGAGVMGKYHANIYAALPDTNLVAVVDPLPERRLDAQRTYGCEGYATIQELLDERHIDAASVAAPTSRHYPISRHLLLSGKHVLVEKPVATDVDQARELARLSSERGLVLQVGHITRFYKAVQLLRERVKAPYLIEARRLVSSARIKDVGVILDLMIHDIDIVLGLVPAPVDEVSVAGHILNGSPHEDVAAAQITFGNGCIARFVASRVAPNPERSLVIAESHQTLRLDFSREPHTEMVIFRPSREEAETSPVHMDRHMVHEDNPLQKELKHFVARIANRAEPIGTLDDDIRSLELATRLMRQLRTVGSRVPA